MIKKIALGKALFISFAALNAYAFGVDVCFTPGDKTHPPDIINCLGVGERCRTSNLSMPQNIACRLDSVGQGISGLSGLNNIQGGRSLVHSDSTYLMAQLIGFSPWQAYQMMIYDEATDQAYYTPFDENGQQILDDQTINACQSDWGADMPTQCLLTTPKLDGISKFNYHTGGMLLHLHARYSDDGKAPLVPDFPTHYLSTQNRAYEVLLANLRAWIFGQRNNACAAGITKQLSTDERIDSPCEQKVHSLNSPMNLFALGFSRLAIPFVTTLGTFILEERTIDGKAANVLANDKSFQAYIGPHQVSYAKFGIFVHALADRHSHHMCTDHSYFYKKSNGNYTSFYSPSYCAQGKHFLWHVWEQGTNQETSNLAIAHQTMRPALEAVYDELIAYARYKGISVNPKLDKAKIINDLIHVLQIYEPNARLQQMVGLMEQYKVLPLPGHGKMASKKPEDWLKQAGGLKESSH